MGFTMPHILILVGAVVTALALLLQIVGFATPSWVKGSSTVLYTRMTIDFEKGLWKSCTGDLCVDISSPEGWLKAVRAFGILAILALVASVVCAVLTFFLPGQKIFPKVAGVAAAVASVCMLIEFAVYAGEASGSSYSFSYSFALTIVAFLLAAVAAALFLLGMNKTAGAA